LKETDVQNHNNEGMTKQTLKQNRLPLMELSTCKSGGLPADTVGKSISFIQRPLMTIWGHKRACVKDH